ncbi:threonine--tRNA ligase [Candidatus Parvarchaeota archaeon]|nr:threonine--tRNA ligase [Candidatus Parvarchaeota archaeon]
MRMVLLHSDFIEFEAVSKAIKTAPEAAKGKERIEECLVALMAIEKDDIDTQAISQNAVAEIVKHAQMVKARRLVLYPWVHLTQEPSSLDVAQKTLAAVSKEANKLVAEGFEIHEAPFGWYKSFNVKCKGHPLAELSRHIGGARKEEARTGKEKMFAKYCIGQKSPAESDALVVARNTASLVALLAVKSLYPKAFFGLAKSDKDGFSCDVEVGRALTPSDLQAVAREMANAAGSKLPIKLGPIGRQQALDAFKASGQKFYLEAAAEIESEVIMVAQANGHMFLLPGPFAPDTSGCGQFALREVGGAYWRNDSGQKQLQRISGTSYEKREQLDAYLKLMQEAEARDHKKLGRELELYMQSDLVGKGLPIWLPNGETIRQEVENLAIETERKYGYVRVKTPNLAKKELYVMSGHIPYYQESMYPEMKLDDGSYFLKAMNCPHHHLVYRHRPRSYRELPLRIAEYGTCYRNELSGTLSGLLRVRMLSMNDAHMYCSRGQIEQEFESVVKMVVDYYRIFGLKDYHFRLSLHDPANKEKYIDEPENWKFAEGVLRGILQKLHVNFVEAVGEAAFYGPKVDIQYKAVTGREETMSTIQLDFAAKTKFGLSYVDTEGKENREVYVIHRAPLSTHERFIAFLIEHYAGSFPVWLSPVQVAVVPLSVDQNEAAQGLAKRMLDSGIRAKADLRQEKMESKIKDAYAQKVPNIIVLGKQEIDAGTVSVRKRGNVQLRDIQQDKFISGLLEEIKLRK